MIKRAVKISHSEIEDQAFLSRANARPRQSIGSTQA